FRHERPWVESYVKRVQGKAHLLLQSLQAGQNDGTERATEEAVKVHGNGSGARIGMRRENGSNLVNDSSITEKARDAREETKQSPTNARHAHHPQQSSNPLSLITEISQTSSVAYPGKRETGNVALLFFKLSTHRYLHTETM